MPIIKKAEIHFAKLDPKRPNNKFNKKNPTWELQIRTTDKAVKKQWEEMGLSVKVVDPDEGQLYYRVNLRKKSKKETGEDSGPVTVVNGTLEAIDPNTIGNGSIANIRVFQYEFTDQASGKKGIASVLMSVQLLKHIVYVPKPRDDDFDMEETETIAAPEGDYGDDDMGPEDDGSDDVPFDGGKPSKAPTPSPTMRTTGNVDPDGDY